MFLATQCRAEDKPSAPALISLDCERLSILVGGAFEYPSTVELAARLVPAVPGAAVTFTVQGDAVEGKVYPAILSSNTAVTDDQGYARVFLISGDAPGTIVVNASFNGQEMSKRLTVDTRWQEEPIVAPHITPPKLQIAPDRVALARERAKDLYDPRVSVRTEAKQTLVGFGQAAIPALIDILSDSNAPWDVRSIATRTLADIRDESSRTSLAWALRHPLGAIRYSAAAGLKGVTDPKLIALVEEALSNPLPGVRSSALEVMTSLPGGIRKAVPLLKDTDPFVRARAAWELAVSDDSDVKPVLDDPGQGLFDDAVVVKHAALRGLATGNDERLHPGVVAALAHTDAAIRAAAVAAAGRAWQDKFLSLVSKDADARVRRALASTAAYILRPSQSLPILRELINDKDEAVRRTARQALTAKADFDDVGLLISLLDDPEVERAVCLSLEHLTFLDFGYSKAATDEERAASVKAWRGWYAGGKGPAQGKAAVLRLAFDTRESCLRGRAALALIRSGQTLTAQEIRPLLLDKHWENRVFGAEALFLAGEHKPAVGTLLDALKSERYDERQAVVRAALETADKAALPVLAAALDDPVREIREQAIDSLQVLAGKRFIFDPSAPAIDRQRSIQDIREALGLEGADR
jgi:HEAT repeat protein